MSAGTGADRYAPLRVAEVANRLERLLTERTPSFWIEAELSVVKRYGTSFFCTFTDGSATLNARIPATLGRGLAFEPTAGLAVLAFGRLAFERERSEVRFRVAAIEPRDLGAMQLAFEQLKAALTAEGLFAAARKRPIPRFVTRVGVVTSRRGSVIHDIRTTLERRWPGIDLVLWPVTVQGSDAADRIAAGIAGLNRAYPDRDVLLVGRGGGSADDLAVFNTERVVRAIVGSAIPVVSCVGHETDLTLADLAADVRAGTPTMAAELVTPVTQADALAGLADRSARAALALQRCADSLAARVAMLGRAPILVEPDRFARAARERVERARAALPAAAWDRLASERHAWHEHAARLHGVSPLAVLERGFSVVRRPGDARVIRDVDELRAGEPLRVRLHAGTFGCEVTTIERAPS
jgi:exodeoxyribonuclease VII large subunit